MSNRVNNAIDKFYQTLGNFDTLSTSDLNRLKEIVNTISKAITNMQTRYSASYTLTKNPKRGDELQQFYFIGKTRNGCPKIERRAIGIKGITCIEVTNVGKSYLTDRHLARVRVSGIKEDGKTPYKMYFKNVFTEQNNSLLLAYCNKSEKFLQTTKQKIKQLNITHTRFCTFIEEQKTQILNNIS